MHSIGLGRVDFSGSFPVVIPNGVVIAGGPALVNSFGGVVIPSFGGVVTGGGAVVGAVDLISAVVNSRATVLLAVVEVVVGIGGLVLLVVREHSPHDKRHDRNM